MEAKDQKMRIIQESVPGKQITLAHLIANPDRIIYKKLGLNPHVDYHKSSIGIITMTPSETAIIAGDLKERKYDPAKHTERLAKIVTGWGEIQRICSKMPRSADLARFMKEIGHPTTGEEIGLNEEDMADAFFMAKDIRDKYVLGRLLWDLGKL